MRNITVYDEETSPEEWGEFVKLHRIECPAKLSTADHMEQVIALELRNGLVRHRYGCWPHLTEEEIRGRKRNWTNPKGRNSFSVINAYFSRGLISSEVDEDCLYGQYRRRLLEQYDRFPSLMKNLCFHTRRISLVF